VCTVRQVNTNYWSTYAARWQLKWRNSFLTTFFPRYSFSTAIWTIAVRSVKHTVRVWEAIIQFPVMSGKNFLHHYIEISVVNSAFIQRLLQNACNQVTWHNILQDLNLCFCKLQNDYATLLCYSIQQPNHKTIILAGIRRKILYFKNKEW
jgi:hypothetical protein